VKIMSDGVLYRKLMDDGGPFMRLAVALRLMAILLGLIWLAGPLAAGVACPMDGPSQCAGWSCCAGTGSERSAMSGCISLCQPALPAPLGAIVVGAWTSRPILAGCDVLRGGIAVPPDDRPPRVGAFA